MSVVYGVGGSVKEAECIGSEPGSHWGREMQSTGELGAIGIE